MPILSQEREDKWKALIRLQEESGLSMDKWCHQNQIAPHKLYYWKRKLLPQPSLSKSSFKELANEIHGSVVIEYRGVLVRLDKHFDPLIFKGCLSMLLEVTC